MKKFIRTLALSLFAVALLGANAMAYQLTLSMAGERTQSQNAAQGTLESAYYNASGLVNLEEGIHLGVGNRFLYLRRASTLDQVSSVGLGNGNVGDRSVEASWSFLLPSIAVAYNFGDLALYFNFAVTNGGAGGKWDTPEGIRVLGEAREISGGTATDGFSDASFTSISGETYTLGYTFGIAGRINEYFALTAGLRVYQKISNTEFEGIAVTLGGQPEKQELRGYGVAALLGFMVTPMDGLNIAVNFLTESYMRNTTTLHYPSIQDNVENSSSFNPAMLAIGIGYEVTEGLEVQLSYNLTLEGDESAGAEYLPGYSENNNNSHAIGIGVEYQVIDLLMVSCGFKYEGTATSTTNNFSVDNPSLNKLAYGFGVVVSPLENIQVDLAFAVHQFLDGEGRRDHVTYITHEQIGLVFGIGVSCSL